MFWGIDLSEQDNLTGGNIMARLTPITGKNQVPAEHPPIVNAIVESRGAVQGLFTMLLHCPPLASHVCIISG